MLLPYMEVPGAGTDSVTPGPALVIEPDEHDRTRVCRALERAGMATAAVDSLEDAPRKLYELQPRIILLAVAPPADAGWEMLARIRELTEAPLLVMSGAGNELAAVRALRAGADDYVTKPLALAELIARVEAVGRRFRIEQPEAALDDGLTSIDLKTIEARADGKLLRLTPLEFRLLTAFVRNPNQVLSRAQLIELVWGDDAPHSVDRVKLAVSSLRNRFREVGVKPPIDTVRGWGYRYRPERGT